MIAMRRDHRAVHFAQSFGRVGVRAGGDSIGQKAIEDQIVYRSRGGGDERRYLEVSRPEPLHFASCRQLEARACREQQAPVLRCNEAHFGAHLSIAWSIFGGAPVVADAPERQATGEGEPRGDGIFQGKSYKLPMSASITEPKLRRLSIDLRDGARLHEGDSVFRDDVVGTISRGKEYKEKQGQTLDSNRCAAGANGHSPRQAGRTRGGARTGPEHGFLQGIGTERKG